MFETQFLINKLGFDKHIGFLIKDYIFVDMLTNEQNKRAKERRSRFGHNRTMLKITVKQQASMNSNYYDDTGNLPLSVYNTIDKECDKMDVELHKYWINIVEPEIVQVWDFFEGMKHRTRNISQDIGIVKRREISYLIRKAKLHETSLWNKFNTRIQNECNVFQRHFHLDLVPFGEHFRFMYLETRDVFFMPYVIEGPPYVPRQYLRLGMMNGDDIETCMKWTKIEIIKNNVSFLCSIDPVTNAIYRVIYLHNFTIPPSTETPLFGVVYNGEIIVF